MWVRKEEKDLFIALRVKSHGFIEVRYRLVILTELVVDFPLVQVGRRIVGVGQRQLLWPLCTNYFGRSGSGVIVVLLTVALALHWSCSSAGRTQG